MKSFLNLFACLLFLFLVYRSTAQTPIPSYFEIEESKLVETKWKYTYALHLESNTIIHKSEDTYEYFLHFRYNNTYQQYLNGKFSSGNWRMKEEVLFYKFKHIQQFTIAGINKQVLVLEFTNDNSRGTYQYHFVRVTAEESPFIKPSNELPLVKVEADNSHLIKKKWWTFSKQKRRKKQQKKASKVPLTYISIELTGGGFYGGIDPVSRDYIHIKNDGRLIREFQSEQNGLIVTKKTIPRDELEKFAKYIVEKDFFTMERLYDCETLLCSKRKGQKPAPIPMRVAVAYGDRRKVITISIFGQDDKRTRYVAYPEALDQIIAAIQKMVHRFDAS